MHPYHHIHLIIVIQQVTHSYTSDLYNSFAFQVDVMSQGYLREAKVASGTAPIIMINQICCTNPSRRLCRLI